MATSPNSPTEQLEPIPATKQRKSRKPPQIKEAVIAHALLGTSNTQIAKELDINRATVASILSSAEINQHIEIGRSRAVSLIPRSLDVAEYRLSKNDGSMALGILRGTNVLQNQSVSGTQLNIQANTWITMRQQKQAENAQIVEFRVIEPAKQIETAPNSSNATQPTSKS